MSSNEEKPGVEIREYLVHGTGVYALRKFQPGEIVLRWNLSSLISNEELSLLPESERIYIHPFGENQILVVQSPERYVNQNCNNNTIVQDFCDIAVRRISPDEEITGDYSKDGAGMKFKCSCGEKKLPRRYQQLT